MMSRDELSASNMAAYWGDNPYPADLWGRCPIRGEAVRVVEELLAQDIGRKESLGECATRIVERLIAVGILPDELNPEAS